VIIYIYITLKSNLQRNGTYVNVVLKF